MTDKTFASLSAALILLIAVSLWISGYAAHALLDDNSDGDCVQSSDAETDPLYWGLVE